MGMLARMKAISGFLLEPVIMELIPAQAEILVLNVQKGIFSLLTNT